MQVETNGNFDPGGDGAAAAHGGVEKPTMHGGEGRTVEQVEAAAAPQPDLGGRAVGLKAYAHHNLTLLAELDGARRIDRGPGGNAIAWLAFPHDRVGRSGGDRKSTRLKSSHKQNSY